MSTEISKTSDSVSGAVIRKSDFVHSASAGGVFTIVCRDKDGNLKWEDSSPNLVVNVGLQDMNAKYFVGTTYTAAWFLGLITGPSSGTTFSAGDTLASHGATGAGGWTEDTNYAGSRKACTFGTATTADPSVITNALNTASFTMNATTTIAGAFLCSVASGTSGILFSASDFQSPGDRAVVNGDVLVVTYTFNLDAT
jgi:hypothetical protein